MNSKRFTTTVLALAIGGFAAASANGADDSTAAAIKRLEAELARQAAQLESQRKQIDAQRAEIQALQQKTAATGAPAAQAATTEQTLATLSKEVSDAKMARQQSPKLAITSGRPTITDADGRSSIALRAVTQLDAAWYD